MRRCLNTAAILVLSISVLLAEPGQNRRERREHQGRQSSREHGERSERHGRRERNKDAEPQTRVSLQEFIFQHSGEDPAAVQQLFEQLDKDHDGFLDAGELKAAKAKPAAEKK